MKKNINSILIACLLIVSSSAISQTIGIKGGVNLSDQSVLFEEKSIFNEKEFNIGFNTGITFGFDFTKTFGVEIGAVLNTKGYQLNIIDELNSKNIFDEAITTFKEKGYDFKRDILYIDVPLLLKMKFGTKKFNIYSKLGPYIGIALSGEEFIDIIDNKSETINDITLNSIKEDLKEGEIKFGDGINETKKIDYGGQIGIGTEINGFFIEGNYKLGLANLSNFENEKTFNHVIEISVGYNFHL